MDYIVGTQNKYHQRRADTSVGVDLVRSSHQVYLHLKAGEQEQFLQRCK